MSTEKRVSITRREIDASKLIAGAAAHPNSNWWKCPECGQSESFYVEPNLGEGEAVCSCPNEECDYSGTVADFIDETPQHTPGEWYWHKGPDDTLFPFKYIFAMSSTTHNLVAEMETINKSSAEIEANARRIVLAVNCHDDLLASLKVMMALVKIRYLERNTPSDGDSAWANKQLRQSEDMKSAQLIIAKAEGKPAC